jgi:hypothetical protein
MQLKLSPFYFILVLVAICFLRTANSVTAQENQSKWFVETPKPTVIDWDTNYYEDYYEEITLRWYSSVKYTGFRILNKDEKQNLLYLSNKNYIFGAGVTYSWFTLNIGLNYPLINNDNDVYGPTNYLDLQTHIYLHKFTFDIYAQVYEGNYLANSANVLSNWPEKDTFQLRPDIISWTIGFNAQYIFNWKKFSFKAAYNQNEWQKKSAGSWVVGANAFFYINEGDSSLIPKNLKNPNLFNGLEYKKQSVTNFGVSAGYYYTLVISKHFFISAGIALGPSLGYSWLDNRNIAKTNFSTVALNINAMARASLGYNSEKFFAGFSFLQQTFLNQIPSDFIWNNFHTGNARFYFVYRFPINKPIKIANPNYWKLFNKEKSK